MTIFAITVLLLQQWEITLNSIQFEKELDLQEKFVCINSWIFALVSPSSGALQPCDLCHHAFMTPVRWQLCNYSKTFNLCLLPTLHSSVPRPSRGAPRNADSSEKAPTWGIRVTLRFFLQWQNQDEHHLHPKDFITAPLPFSQAWCFPGHPCPGSILVGVSENCHLMAFSSFQILHSSCTSSSHSCFNWRHSSPTISQLWAGQNTQYPRARHSGHSRLPQTWEAASFFGSCVWVQKSSSKETVMAKLEFGSKPGLDSLLLSFLLKMPDKETWRY